MAIARPARARTEGGGGGDEEDDSDGGRPAGREDSVELELEPEIRRRAEALVREMRAGIGGIGDDEGDLFGSDSEGAADCGGSESA